MNCFGLTTVEQNGNCIHLTQYTALHSISNLNLENIMWREREDRNVDGEQ